MNGGRLFTPRRGMVVRLCDYGPQRSRNLLIPPRIQASLLQETKPFHLRRDRISKRDNQSLALETVLQHTKSFCLLTLSTTKYHPCVSVVVFLELMTHNFGNVTYSVNDDTRHFFSSKCQSISTLNHPNKLLLPPHE